MIHIGDCLEVMAGMEAESVDAIVTDPPYGLSFMGKNWDHGTPGEAFWREALRIAKPGTHLLAFGGSRTYHRLTVAIEDAGWEVRDCLMWVYGSGFPKSLDVSKAIDKEAGAEREVVGSYTVGGTAAKGKRNGRAAAASDEGSASGCSKELAITAPATESAKQWHGWGTALKPAYEPIVLARKPIKGTVAANVQEYGTGAVNIDGCRVEGEISPSIKVRESAKISGKCGGDIHTAHRIKLGLKPFNKDIDLYCRTRPGELLGRWPANFIHDGSDEVTGLMSEAARFFYCAKASKADRDEGLKKTAHRGNHHPTVKPNSLMRYLCRLVTPPGGIVLDPFCGSGSTGKAAIMEGFRFVGIELNPEYAAIAQARIDAARPLEPLFHA